MRSVRDSRLRQELIKRPAAAPALRDQPARRLQGSGDLWGVITKVYRQYEGKLVAVRLMKTGLDPLDIQTWGIDGNGVFQPSSIDEWFEETEHCVYVTPGTRTWPGIPIEVKVTQAARLCGRPLYQNAGSYEPGDPENRGCEPDADELLPDLGSDCGEPDAWSDIDEESVCCDPADPTLPCFGGAP